MTAVFQRDRIRFQYPENWSLSDDSLSRDSDLDVRLTLEAPGGATWMLFGLPTPSTAEALQYAWEALRQEYGELELSPAEAFWEGDPPAASQEAQFLFMDLVVRAQAHALEFGEGSLLILVQAEDREFDQTEPVFRAMAISLIREL